MYLFDQDDINLFWEYNENILNPNKLFGLMIWSTKSSGAAAQLLTSDPDTRKHKPPLVHFITKQEHGGFCVFLPNPRQIHETRRMSTAAENRSIMAGRQKLWATAAALWKFVLR